VGRTVPLSHCGEPFAFNRAAGIAELQDAYIQVAHLHDDDGAI
jgi:hypothetical protein